jgi:peptide-O-fucosyltransferase
VGSIIDVVYYLQNYKEGWTNGEFVEKIDFRDCLNQVPYQRDHENGKWKGPFWQYRQVRAKDFKCVSVQGTTRIMRDFIGKSANDDHKTIMLDRAETLLHDYFGDAEYWSVRRSMRFASHLTEIANDFRKDYLNSNDKDDNTNWPENWKNHKPSRGTAQGGPYICAHIRRKDYVYSRKDFIPNLKSAAEQLIRKCSDHNVKTVFIATDAPKEEFEELKTFMKDLKVFRYQPSTEVSTLYQDGGVAIIDQSVCSNAKYFIGSIESTFTFRIQEEREILGFNVEQSFDILCKTGEFDCKKGSVWKIAYPDANEYDIPHAEL